MSLNATSIQRKSQAQSNCPAMQNVEENERWISGGLGAALTAYGLRSRSPLGLLAAAAGAGLMYRGWTGHCAVYQNLGIDTSGCTRPGVRAKRGQRVVKALHINRAPQDLYDFWRNLSNLPRVMRHLKSVSDSGDGLSRWVASAPLGQELSWTAEIITDRPGETIAWQSTPDSQVHTAGSVHFRRPEFGTGTELTIELKYEPPGGRVAAVLAHLLGKGLEEELQEDLRKFKQWMEAGEISTSNSYPTA